MSQGAQGYLVKSRMTSHCIDRGISLAIERKKLITTLTESKEELSLLFNNIRDGVVLISTTGRLLKANNRVFESVVISLRSLSAMRLEELKMFTTSGIKMFNKNVKDLMKGLEVEPSVYKFKAKNGQELLLKVYLSLIKKEDNIIGILSVVRDVHEQHT
jgi:PAS domain S-box-containing protein